MDYLKLAELRRSTRDFRKRRSMPFHLERLVEYTKNCKKLVPDLKTEIVHLNESVGEKLDGVAGYMGYMIKAPHYFILLSEPGEYAVENAGYMGADLLFKITEMELDSCWITFHGSDRVKEALELESEKEVMAIIAFGQGKWDKPTPRIDIISPSNVEIHKRKGYMAPKISLEEMIYHGDWGNRENWESTAGSRIPEAFRSASLAPTYLNRQPYRFIQDSALIALVIMDDEMTDAHDSRLNAGIVMLHFAAVMQQKQPEFHWNPGKPKKKYALPEGCRIAAWCEI